MPAFDTSFDSSFDGATSGGGGGTVVIQPLTLSVDGVISVHGSVYAGQVIQASFLGTVNVEGGVSADIGVEVFVDGVIGVETLCECGCEW